MISPDLLHEVAHPSFITIQMGHRIQLASPLLYADNIIIFLHLI